MFSLNNPSNRADEERGKLNRISAKKAWPFLTPFDFASIRTEGQLAFVVRDRTGMSKDEAAAQVHDWLVVQEAKQKATDAVILDEVHARPDSSAGAAVPTNDN
ncbi:hypothetical protein IHQ68_13800 [Chelatococcus sambhunathii]|uniref:Uncharacterized protein n=1 Tax=Chelatococcus sambhunathii TaxID=363953 RepID=A0ABU1DHT2_9HYPH|nr:hypothetical protein [Chelatococcus sambhunathii]MDR4307692.1 hypothetical protein [Chelatococcus sambhunathii]